MNYSMCDTLTSTNIIGTCNAPIGLDTSTTLDSLTSRDEIRNILRRDLQPWSDSPNVPIANLRWTEKFKSFTSTDPITGKLRHKFLSQVERTDLLSKETICLYNAASDRQDHISKLEDIFSNLFFLREFRVQSDEHESVIVDLVWSFLKQMPAYIPELPEALDHVPSLYFHGEVKSWGCLKVGSLVHSNLIRVMLSHVLAVVFYGGGGDLAGTTPFQECLNDIGGIIDSISLGTLANVSQPDAVSWFIVRCYLWSFWQRAKTFNYFVCVKEKLRIRGDSREWHIGDLGYTYASELQFSPSPGVPLRQLSLQLSHANSKPKNICNWSLELLVGQPMCHGLDFRLFYERYTAVFSQEPARCRQNSQESCDGKHFQNCLRFYGAKIVNQAAHDVSCTYSSPSEPRLPWDEASYRSVQGARAVRIDSVMSSRIRYCAASERTLAISHVWSHGQGGRPEEGINQCLHSRYCTIAKQFGCDSYWVDAICIPEDHNLRKEAISQINRVFTSSRVVLVCDMDLMKINVDNPTIQLKESLLVSLILSDWNTRAWTLLESMKGRQAIYILCKNNAVINLADLLSDLVIGGRIDIVVFIWHVFHMLPSTPRTKLKFEIRFNFPEYPISDIGSWLSYRPASRSGDEFVIWSLLIDPTKQPYSDATSFWRGQVGRSIHTGYLMSTARRLWKKGLSWAPESPFVTTKAQTEPTSSHTHRGNHAHNTEHAEIAKSGLWGLWLRYEFKSKIGSLIDDETPLEKELNKIRSQFLGCFEYGVLLRPRWNTSSANRELDSPGQRGECHMEGGTLVAVCASNKITRLTLRNFKEPSLWPKSYRWIWRGVYEWPKDTPLPPLIYHLTPSFADYICIA